MKTRIAELNREREALDPELLKVRGRLQPLSSHMLARVLYGARNARIELLRAVNRLGCFIHYWDVDCDARFMRLIAYIGTTLYHRQLNWIEPLRTLRMMNYCAWLASRWQDPAFPMHFPWFNTDKYWSAHIVELREQQLALEQPMYASNFLQLY